MTGAEAEPPRDAASGRSKPTVVLLHGGPGAPGTMAPVTRGLADAFTVLEPWQRRSDGSPLTVARHVEDLRSLVNGECGSAGPPAIVGHSWGAMLALAFGAAHPDLCGPLVLVGSGTFDEDARAELQRRLAARMNASFRERLAALENQIADPDARLAAMGELLLPVYGHDLLPLDQELGPCDARGHHETWDDMLRLQREGLYPGAFSAIRSPVLMVHGAQDPHPGGLVRSGLQRVLPQLEYHEWSDCGHTPWLERAAREPFFEKLRMWLLSH
jgi:pimeloyl-ACP methyl ester carboxylesterase